MISNILTNFFNYLTIPILVLNYKFETIFAYNHDSKINNFNLSCTENTNGY